MYDNVTVHDTDSFSNALFHLCHYHVVASYDISGDALSVRIYNPVELRTDAIDSDTAGTFQFGKWSETMYHTSLPLRV